jgi:hypothetical protein
MYLSHKVIAIGALLTVWSLVCAAALTIALELDVGRSLAVTVASDSINKILVIADVSSFIVGCGILSCGVVMRRDHATAGRVAGRVSAFVIGYVATVAIAIVLLAWLESRSPLRGSHDDRTAPVQTTRWTARSMFSTRRIPKILA